MVLDGLCNAVAASAPRSAQRAPLLLLWSYLRRLIRRFDSLVSRSRVGRIAPRPRQAHARSASKSPPPRLPQGFGWLIRAMPIVAAGYGSQLRHLLDDPAMQTLMAATPQAVRMLRPLCRMLRMELPTATPRTAQPIRRRWPRPGSDPSHDWAQHGPMPQDLLAPA